MSIKKCPLLFTLFSFLAFGPNLHVMASGLTGIKTVFVIMMENHDWSTILEPTYCPYIKDTLLPRSSFCTQYYNPPTLHPSLPNYLWLEGGTNFGITTDGSPANFPAITTTNHLVTLLKNAGISWRTYQEGIPGNTCPSTDISAMKYVTRHDPFVFFTDVTSSFFYCTNHLRPYSELAADLENNRVARYNFITPNLTNDMHDVCTGCPSRRILGDHWLALEVPKILTSQAWSNNGALFIVWDEGSNDMSDGPIGCMVLSPLAKGRGYSNAVHYTHSSTLRTMQDIFGVGPYLRDAAKAIALTDLFVNLRLTSATTNIEGHVSFTITGTIPGRTHIVEASTDLVSWQPISTNVAVSATTSFIDPRLVFDPQFYRVALQP